MKEYRHVVRQLAIIYPTTACFTRPLFCTFTCSPLSEASVITHPLHSITLSGLVPLASPTPLSQYHGTDFVLPDHSPGVNSPPRVRRVAQGSTRSSRSPKLDSCPPKTLYRRRCTPHSLSGSRYRPPAEIHFTPECQDFGFGMEQVDDDQHQEYHTIKPEELRLLDEKSIAPRFRGSACRRRPMPAWEGKRRFGLSQLTADPIRLESFRCS